MASAIDDTNGRINFAQSVHNQRAWWESDAYMGQRVSPDAPIGEWHQAGLPWEVRKTPMRYRVGGIMQKVAGKYVIYRDDTDAALGSASDKYHIHTIAEIMDGLDRLCKAGDYKMNTLGSLNEGREIWGMVSTEANDNIAGEKFLRNIVVTTDFTASKPTRIFRTDIAVVCQNTLSWAMASADKVFKLSHRSAYNPQTVIGDLGLVTADQELFESEIELLASKQFAYADLQNFWDNLVLGDKKRDELTPENRAKVDDIIRGIEDSYRYAPGGLDHHKRVESRVGTLHGATQAVYHYADHKMLMTQAGSPKKNALSRSLFGDASKLKMKAHTMALSEI